MQFGHFCHSEQCARNERQSFTVIGWCDRDPNLLPQTNSYLILNSRLYHTPLKIHFFLRTPIFQSPPPSFSTGSEKALALCLATIVVPIDAAITAIVAIAEIEEEAVIIAIPPITVVINLVAVAEIMIETVEIAIETITEVAIAAAAITAIVKAEIVTEAIEKVVISTPKKLQHSSMRFGKNLLRKCHFNVN